MRRDEKFNYYREQFDKLSFGKAGQYAPKVKLTANDTKTNFMDLNHESATELVRFLKLHFKISFDESLNLLKVKILPWTNKLPRRIKIISERFKQSVVIPFHDEGPTHVNAADIAKEWLTKQGFVINGHSEGKECSYLMSETFKPLKH